MLYNSKSISISTSTEKNTQLLYRQLSKTKLDRKNINMKQAMGKTIKNNIQYKLLYIYLF